MFQRKLIAVFGVVALLATVAASSQASRSRVEGMGIGDPILSQFTDDFANIYTYPTSVVRQNNFFAAELGSNPDGNTNEVQFSDQSITLIKNFPKIGAIAYQMKAHALNSAFPDNLTHEQFDLIWGRALSKLDIAVRLDVTNSSYEHTDNAGGTVTSYEARGSGFDPSDPYPFGIAFSQDAIVDGGVVGPIEINTTGITPAVAIHLSDDKRIEGAITFRTYSLDRNITVGGVAGEKWEDDGGLSYALVIRGIVNRGDRSTWYPAFWYVNNDLSYKVAGIPGLGPRSAEETYKNMGIGLAHNMKVNDNNLLIFGVGARQMKHEYTRTDNNADAGGTVIVSGETKTFEEKSTTFPAFLACLETQATSWLKVRIGGTKGMESGEEKTSNFLAPTGTESNKEKFSEFTFNIGAGFSLNNLDIDLTVNEALPLSGGYIFSGDMETLATRASATYRY